MLSYIAIYPETLELMEEYSEADRYLLIAAMLSYGTTGVEPEFSDAKKYVWKSLKQAVDRMSAKSEAQRSNRQKKTEPAEPTETKKTKPNQLNQTEPTEPTETELTYDNDKENDTDTETECVSETEEEEEEDDKSLLICARAREEADQAWQMSFGRKPTPAALERLERTVRLCGFDAGIVSEAIRIAAQKMPADPLKYVLTLLNDWHNAAVKTAADLDTYLALYERANDKGGTWEDTQAMLEFRHRRRSDTA